MRLRLEVQTCPWESAKIPMTCPQVQSAGRTGHFGSASKTGTPLSAATGRAVCVCVLPACAPDRENVVAESVNTNKARFNFVLKDMPITPPSTPLWRDGDCDFLIRCERTIVGAAAEHVSSRLAENDARGDSTICGKRIGNPDRRPRRIRSGASILPNLDLRRIKRNLSRTSIDEPGNM